LELFKSDEVKKLKQKLMGTGPLPLLIVGCGVEVKRKNASIA
jgi:hypothetical protein